MLSLHFLHGFLGKPADWDFISNNDFLRDFSCHYEDVLSYSINSFSNFAKEYNQKISSTKQLSEKKVLVGYSMGGRLALHAIEEMKKHSETQKLWDAAIFISTHPGLDCEKERASRVKADEQWANKFENIPWENLMRDWNSQAVFKKSTFNFKRNEEDIKREEIAKILRVFSLGVQKSFTKKLQEFDLPILWMVGENDENLVSTLKKILLKHPLSSICIMPKASHRVPFELQDNFITRIQEFLTSLKETKHDKDFS